MVMANHQLVVFLVNGLRLALPLISVRRVVAAAYPSPLPGAPASVLGVIDLQGEMVAVLDMRARLALPSRALQPEDCFLIVDLPDRTLAVWVDEVEGVVEVHGEQQDVSAFLPDDEERIVQALGRASQGIVLIQDAAKFFSPRQARELDEALESAS
jgi:purine-binding chemotaxis protein CheW